MGLDNGFVVMSDRRTITRDDLPSEIDYPFSTDYNNAPEIIYWRKNWGLRAAMTRILRAEEGSEGDPYFVPGYYYADTPNDIIKIIEIVISFLDKEIWEDEGNSIWEYEEARPRLVRDIMNLAIIYGYMLENPDVYLRFYDSY